MVAIRQITKALPENVPDLNECATMLVNMLSRLRKINKTKNFQTSLPFCVQDHSFLIFLLVPDFLSRKKNVIALLYVL